MLSLTRKADYALVALVLLGHRAQRGEGPVSARQVARTFGLPEPVLMNTLKALARFGLVRSQRGAAGGYELIGDPAEISLMDAVRAMEGEQAPAEHAAEASGGAVERLERRVNGFLAGLTIADLLDKSPEAGNDASREALVALRTNADT